MSKINKNKIYLFIILVIILGILIFAFQNNSKNNSSNLYQQEKKSIEQVEKNGIKNITLEVTSPANNSKTSSSELILKGKTVPNAEVLVNDEETRADTSGNFSVNVAMEEGENIIIVFVNDQNGDYVEKEIKVIYTP